MVYDGVIGKKSKFIVIVFVKLVKKKVDDIEGLKGK